MKEEAEYLPENFTAYMECEACSDEKKFVRYGPNLCESCGSHCWPRPYYYPNEHNKCKEDRILLALNWQEEKYWRSSTAAEFAIYIRDKNQYNPPYLESVLKSLIQKMPDMWITLEGAEVLQVFIKYCEFEEQIRPAELKLWDTIIHNKVFMFK